MEAAVVKSPVDMGPALKVIQEMSPLSSGDIIPLLQRLQDAYGYLPPAVVLAVCNQTGLPASRVFGVATFYEQFHLEPSGRHTVRCCRGTACHVKGGRGIARALERELGVNEGETTPDGKFTFQTVACLGTCFLAPVMMVDRNYYGRMTPSRVKRILEQFE
jgi:NADH-quinone oxidoreductase subunit E